MFIIQSLPYDLPATFGKIAELILNIICSAKANELHFICDRYVKSIKNLEQLSRGTSEGAFHITGADQLRPKDFRHALRSPSFKTAFVKFLIQEWKDNKYASVIKQKLLVVAHEDHCMMYTSDTSQVHHQEIPVYDCDHVEADTRLLYHLAILSEANPGQNVVVRATDTDIMIIFLYHARCINAKVWMDIGHSSDNTRRYVNITALANQLGPVLCKALPGYHALTGCDYTSAFFRKGKIGPLKKAEKNALHLEGLGSLGETTTFVNENELVESYVCDIYGQSGLSSVNDARLKIFLQKYKPTDPNCPMEKIKGIDAGMLPPCKNVLQQKLTRTNFVSYLWKHASQTAPNGDMLPTDHGWVDCDNLYVPVWFTGDQMPTVLSETVEQGDIEDRLDEDDLDENDSDDNNMVNVESEDECDSDDDNNRGE